MPGGIALPPQFVEIIPRLIILPIIVPQPSRVALLEITNPLAKEWVPPLRWNVAGVMPSPTTKGDPLPPVVLLALRAPPLNRKFPAIFVTRRLSVVTVPPFMLTVPLAGIRAPKPAALVTAILPPLMN